MTYFRIKGDDGAHEVLQALMSTWKPVGHVQQADPRPSNPENSDPGYSNTGYLFSESSSGYLYAEYPLNPKKLPSNEYFNKFKVPTFDSLQRNPPVSPVPPSDHGSPNVVQAPVPILKSWEIYTLPRGPAMGRRKWSRRQCRTQYHQQPIRIRIIR